MISYHQSTLILSYHIIITLCILPIRGLYLTQSWLHLHAMQSSVVNYSC